jgi:hypothetical protein
MRHMSIKGTCLWDSKIATMVPWKYVCMSLGCQGKSETCDDQKGTVSGMPKDGSGI